MKKDIHDYSDIINMPYHKSKVHKPMSLIDRAAQFAPFAALTGHKEAVVEAGRLTSDKIILDEHQKYLLDIQINELLPMIDTNPLITVTYFEPDLRKTGGKYLTVTGHLKKVDEQNRVIWLDNPIKIDDILDIEINDKKGD